MVEAVGSESRGTSGWVPGLQAGPMTTLRISVSGKKCGMTARIRRKAATALRHSSRTVLKGDRQRTGTPYPRVAIAGDEEAESAYLDRWMYDILGYQRG